MDWTMIIVCLIWIVGGTLFVCKVACPLEAEKVYDKTSSSRQERVNNANTNTRPIFRKQLYNERLNTYKEYHEGFSWTVLLFGFWPALFRSDWKWAIIILLCSSATFGIASIFFAFKYNELYVHELIKQGYKIIEK